MDLDFQHIFIPPPIDSTTINTIALHPAIRMIIYMLIALVCVTGFIVLLAKKYPISEAISKAAVAAFFISGLTYAIRADIGWTTWLIYDFKIYGGLETEDKLLQMEGKSLHDFIDNSKNILPNTYQIYSTSSGLKSRIEYSLLPKRKEANAEFIVVNEDKLSHFDPVKHLFTRGDETIQDVDMVFFYDDDAYILRRKN